MTLSSVRHESMYLTIKELHEKKGYTIVELCSFESLGITRSAYYKWIKREKTENEIHNERLIGFIKEAYEERDAVPGYRQMKLILKRDYHENVNEKRVLRLMRVLGLKSIIRRKRPSYIKSTPEITAENILKREFKADSYNQKWLTDVTEFKYGNSGQKAYLSAILDLGDRHIVAWVVGHSNNNVLVFDTFHQAVKANPDAKPIFHSDRGFQYTTRTFNTMIKNAGMIQSMSRVGRCIDNGPMEGFWGILKAEMYYLHKFDDYESLMKAIEKYIWYYNHKRYQKRLKGMAPMEYHEYLEDGAA